MPLIPINHAVCPDSAKEQPAWNEFELPETTAAIETCKNEHSIFELSLNDLPAAQRVIFVLRSDTGRNDFSH